MAIPSSLRQLTDQFFEDQHLNYNFETVEGCGQYMEDLIPYAQDHGYPKVGFLKYTGSGTKYNNHRIDSFLYNEVTENGKLQSCDVIANAETDHASAGWGLDEPRYTEDDWVKDLDDLIEPSNPVNTVPWRAYWGDNSDFNNRVQQQLAYDYGRRPQGADFGVTAWSSRLLHSAYFGPEGTPLGEDGALRRHRPEWCQALGVPVDDMWF